MKIQSTGHHTLLLDNRPKSPAHWLTKAHHRFPNAGSAFRRGLSLLIFWGMAAAQVVPADQRGRVDAERAGTHDANNLRTIFYNYGMVGDYPPDPVNVDLSVFHSFEVPKGSGVNYCDGTTPFILSMLEEEDGSTFYIMESGYRERQETSPFQNRLMRFEPRPGYFQSNAALNVGRSPAISNDPRTWPDSWPDKVTDADDPGWSGSWNGYLGKSPTADQESYTVMDDDFYDKWDYYPDSRDSSRRGMALRVEVRGFQWANLQSGNVIFWHYDITNEGTTEYNDNVIFGLYLDSGVGGSALSCDGVYESDDDNAFFDDSFDLNLTYTWDKRGHGVGLNSNCTATGYLGYAYLETPGNPYDGTDNDNDGIVDELRDGGEGTFLEDQEAILAWLNTHYDVVEFEHSIGSIASRPAYKYARWWTGDEDMDWVAELHDTGADGVFGTNDTGEEDGIPTNGEPNFDKTDLNESDQIGLTGFKMNRIKAGAGNPSNEVDGIVFFDDGKAWPRRLYDFFTSNAPYDQALALNYNIGFLFASGPFRLPAAKQERFSLALSYGANFEELRTTVHTVQLIYNANYQFAVPPAQPIAQVSSGDGWVRLSWNDLAERGVDPVSLEADFEGYRIYRSTDADFRDPKLISNAMGTGTFGNGKPIAQFDLVNDYVGFSAQVVEGISYYLGNNTGITHTFTDSTVTNGQLYYYAVCAYDRGSDSLDFFPSENSITVSRTLRGGTILPTNVVMARPEPPVMGFTPATATAATKTQGRGVGTATIEVINSQLVPENHRYQIRFRTTSSDSIRASYYDLIDHTLNETVFTNSTDLDGLGTGYVGHGLLPIIQTPRTVTVDTLLSGFAEGSVTNTQLKVSYQHQQPIFRQRAGYPDPLRITFANEPLDTSLAAIGRPARPMNFKIEAMTDSTANQLNFYMYEDVVDGTLTTANEYIDVVTYVPEKPTTAQTTWRIQLDTVGQSQRGTIVPPGEDDVYELKLHFPMRDEDVFEFSTTAEYYDESRAENEFDALEPYVVPNPYVGSASFEPERFAISGRGERRVEFRNLPPFCTIRIYTIRGYLVKTLTHDGTMSGAVAWDLRTKDNLDLAPGLYIFHVEADGFGSKTGKFSIIK